MFIAKYSTKTYKTDCIVYTTPLGQKQKGTHVDINHNTHMHDPNHSNEYSDKSVHYMPHQLTQSYRVDSPHKENTNKLYDSHLNQ